VPIWMVFGGLARALLKNPGEMVVVSCVGTAVHEPPKERMEGEDEGQRH